MVIRSLIPYLLVFTLTAFNIGQGAALSQDAPGLVVAWVEGGGLFVWRQGGDAPRQLVEAEFGVMLSHIAPDGEHIAYIAGDAGDLLGDTLYVIQSDGNNQQLLIEPGDLEAAEDSSPIINSVRWANESVLYFNTAQVFPFGREERDDLYRVDVTTGEVEQVLPAGEGGAFNISPDQQWVAVVQAGTYGNADGRISFMNTSTLEKRDIFTFTGVSTGSEYQFYPGIYWEMDSSGLHVAIPHYDLIYDEINSSPTALWRIGIDGSSEQIGTVPASFFGQPRWSGDNAFLTYVQRVGRLEDNRFEVILAVGDGSDPATYLREESGLFEQPQWMPGTNLFVYTLGNPGELWLGGPDRTPQRLPNENEMIFNPVFTERNFYVFSTMPADAGVELRYARLDAIGQPSTLIAGVGEAYPIFDAVILER